VLLDMWNIVGTTV